MNNDLLFDGKTYISVSRASKKLGYTADYIGQLCRAGKIDARMIGRTWYVEWESIKNHKKSKKHRIRRTAAEIQRDRRLSQEVINPVAEDFTLESDCPPEEYLEKIDAQHKNLKIAEPTASIPEPVVNLIPFTAIVENKKVKEIEIIHTPVESKQVEEALPIIYSYDHQSEWLPKLSKKENVSTTVQKKAVISPFNNHPLLIGALAIFIFFNLAFVGINLISPELSKSVIVSNIENSLSFSSSNSLAINSGTTNTENLSSIYGGIKGFWNSIFDGIAGRINKFAIRYMNSLGFAQKTNEVRTESNTPITEGLVVLPDDKNHDAKVASIKKTFSDEVEVKPDPDNESGVIVPKFREADGEGYTYVLIPINSP